MQRIDGYKHIVRVEGVCGGDPVIEGTRLEPKFLVRYGTMEEVLEDFNQLTKEQVEEAFKFVKENKLNR